MAREIIDMPTSLLRVMTCDWQIDWRGKRSPGGLQTGIDQFPRWVGAPQFFLHRAQIAEWRAIQAHLEGLAGILRLEMIDTTVYSARAENPGLWERGVPFSDGTYFSDGTGFKWMPFVIAQADIPAGAPEMVVAIEAGAPAPKMGQIMSYEDWPFTLGGVVDLGGGLYRLTVKRLRVAIPAGGLIDLRPHGLFEKVEGLGGNPGYSARLVSRPTLKLQEVLIR